MDPVTNPHLVKFFQSYALCDIAPVFDNYTNIRERNKEITESMGCLNAVQFTQFAINDPEVTAFVVGDGKRPRTGVILAYYTRWNIVSIDPHLDYEWFHTWRSFKSQEGHLIKRLNCVPSSAQDAFSDLRLSKVVLVLPHSHAPFKDSIQMVHGSMDIISMPCCVKVPQKLCTERAILEHNYRSYIDPDVLSPHNTVHVWHNMSLETYKSFVEPSKTF